MDSKSGMCTRGNRVGIFIKLDITSFYHLNLQFVNIFRLPLWSYAKLILTCWLVIPYFNGAAYVYEYYVRPTFVTRETVNIWYVPRKKDACSKPDDILTAAKKYIQEHGADEFEDLIHRVSCNIARFHKYLLGSHFTLTK